MTLRLVRLAQMINPGLMGSIMDMLDALPGIDRAIQTDRDKWEATRL